MSLKDIDQALKVPSIERAAQRARRRAVGESFPDQPQKTAAEEVFGQPSRTKSELDEFRSEVTRQADRPKTLEQTVVQRRRTVPSDRTLAGRQLNLVDLEDGFDAFRSLQARPTAQRSLQTFREISQDLKDAVKSGDALAAQRARERYSDFVRRGVKVPRKVKDIADQRLKNVDDFLEARAKSQGEVTRIGRSPRAIRERQKKLRLDDLEQQFIDKKKQKELSNLAKSREEVTKVSGMAGDLPVNAPVKEFRKRALESSTPEDISFNLSRLAKAGKEVEVAPGKFVREGSILASETAQKIRDDVLSPLFSPKRGSKPSIDLDVLRATYTDPVKFRMAKKAVNELEDLIAKLPAKVRRQGKLSITKDIAKDLATRLVAAAAATGLTGSESLGAAAFAGGRRLPFLPSFARRAMRNGLFRHLMQFSRRKKLAPAIVHPDKVEDWLKLVDPGIDMTPAQISTIIGRVTGSKFEWPKKVQRFLNK